MNKELTDKLQSQAVDILVSLQNAAGQATELAKRELPDMAMQYVAYGRGYYTVLMLALLTAAGLSIWSFVHGMARMSKDKDFDPSANLICGVVGCLLFVPLVLGNLSNFLMVWVAPKIWLVQSIVELVK